MPTDVYYGCWKRSGIESEFVILPTHKCQKRTGTAGFKPAPTDNLDVGHCALLKKLFFYFYRFEHNRQVLFRHIKNEIKERETKKKEKDKVSGTVCAHLFTDTVYSVI